MVIFNIGYALYLLEKQHGLFKRLVIRFLQCHSVDDIVVVYKFTLMFPDGFQQRSFSNFFVVHNKEYVWRMFLNVLMLNKYDALFLLPIFA